MFSFTSPRKYETPNPIMQIKIEITELAFHPSTQLPFKTFGIIDKNSPKIIENVAV